jgi:hypothetical protein
MYEKFSKNLGGILIFQKIIEIATKGFKIFTMMQNFAHTKKFGSNLSFFGSLVFAKIIEM